MSVNINKVYTKGGDGGKTRLVGGVEVDKCCAQVEAYGTVDEMNAHLGVLRTLLDTSGISELWCTQLLSDLAWLQQKAFDIGSILATPPGKTWEGQPVITAADVAVLESRIDDYNEDLPALKSFTLPGGDIVNAHLHVLRTTSRRAERRLWAWEDVSKLAPELVQFVNRLSDYFFVCARMVSAKQGSPEYLWHKNIEPSIR